MRASCDAGPYALLGSAFPADVAEFTLGTLVCRPASDLAHRGDMNSDALRSNAEGQAEAATAGAATARGSSKSEPIGLTSKQVGVHL